MSAASYASAHEFLLKHRELVYCIALVYLRPNTADASETDLRERLLPAKDLLDVNASLLVALIKGERARWFLSNGDDCEFRDASEILESWASDMASAARAIRQDDLLTAYGFVLKMWWSGKKAEAVITPRIDELAGFSEGVLHWHLPAVEASPATAPAAPESNDKHTLECDVDGKAVTFDGERIPMTSAMAVRFLRVLLKNEGKWITAKKLNGFDREIDEDCKPREFFRRKYIPQQIAVCIDRNGRPGGGYLLDLHRREGREKGAKRAETKGAK
ncbi:hypothetical protein Pan44_43230 [Caulifigura coniformis]|uniref:Uncharacterized protein n=1 Tax=Caulifigura coniformis TaxID=2527983 RepID=A0A517SJG4_9PLAN|nr:hypothetical protein [Caulifigura coniformis]QDT56270.1 hypothetical protein Pan44_43230 [Caulifigura coniformis]